MFSFIRKIIGSSNDRIVKKLFLEVARVNALESEMQKLTDLQLGNKTQEFKNRINNGESLDSLSAEAFAVVREAAKRVIGLRHFDVQILGGFVLHKAMIAEMRTGEGKTLVATLPAYLNALTGHGVHVVTVNDYLAKRDANWMGQIYKFLGLSVGCITNNLSSEERKQVYNCDIVYATNNELGFDFLRDNMMYNTESKVQKSYNFAIIDEVDSILIDEARTPLIISGPAEDNVALYPIIDKIVSKLESQDYDKDEKLRSIHLTEQGISHIEKVMIQNNIIAPNSTLYDFDNLSLVHYINQSLKAHYLYRANVDYILQDKKVLIIDELTGRIMHGRRYSDGLHQALEAKEGMPIQNENQTLASITFQNYFRMYKKLSGMTGTAITEEAEFNDIYNLEVVVVPTHNSITRIDHDDEIYGTIVEKNNAIVNLIKECYAKGQPVLIGTISVEKSEELSKVLQAHNIKHNVLNAKFHHQEAYIIAQAGRPQAVTIATNMAGRGTDILLGGNVDMLIDELRLLNLSNEKFEQEVEKLKTQVSIDKQKVLEAGGLYIIGTERHESRRIDNQLRGRAGRQGDIGHTKFFLSLEDDLMRIFASERIASILKTLGLKNGEPIQHNMITRSIAKAQQKVEAHNFEIRKTLLRFDDVMNDQRKIIYEQRNDIINDKENLENIFLSMSKQIVQEVVLSCIDPKAYREDWDINKLSSEVVRIFNIKFDTKFITDNDVTEVEITNNIYDDLKDIYHKKCDRYTQTIMNDAIKYIFLTTIDQFWKEHLHNLDCLRQGISLRAYGQKDPLMEYKKEAFELFQSMLNTFREVFVQRICMLQIDIEYLKQGNINMQEKSLEDFSITRDDPAFEKYNSGVSLQTQMQRYARVNKESRVSTDINTWGKVSRNESCPCGSGKKYKHCHGLTSKELLQDEKVHDNKDDTINELTKKLGVKVSDNITKLPIDNKKTTSKKNK